MSSSKNGPAAISTALLIIDMQNFFSSQSRSCLPNVLKLIQHFHPLSLPICLTQHGHTDSELTSPYNNQLVRKWGPENSIRIGTEDWQLLPEIQSAQEKDHLQVFGKNSYDAFLGNELEETLRSAGVERVVTCGVLTDCCVDCTSKSAFNRGFEVWVAGDACESGSKAGHERMLEGFGDYYGEMVDTEEVIKRLMAEKGG